MDITELILSDHNEQRRMFAILDEIPRDDGVSLGAIWTRLAAMLEVHAQAEEEIFYPELLKLGERHHDAEELAETKDAIGDHNDIRDGITQAAGAEVGSDDWWDGVLAARKANDEHMGEEEHEGLRAFRLHVELELRRQLAVRFAVYEAQRVSGVPVVDKDPDQYVHANR